MTVELTRLWDGDDTRRKGAALVRGDPSHPPLSSVTSAEGQVASCREHSLEILGENPAEGQACVSRQRKIKSVER